MRGQFLIAALVMLNGGAGYSARVGEQSDASHSDPVFAPMTDNFNDLMNLASDFEVSLGDLSSQSNPKTKWGVPAQSRKRNSDSSAALETKKESSEKSEIAEPTIEGNISLPESLLSEVVSPENFQTSNDGLAPKSAEVSSPQFVEKKLVSEVTEREFVETPALRQPEKLLENAGAGLGEKSFSPTSNETQTFQSPGEKKTSSSNGSSDKKNLSDSPKAASGAPSAKDVPPGLPGDANTKRAQFGRRDDDIPPLSDNAIAQQEKNKREEKQAKAQEEAAKQEESAQQKDERLKQLTTALSGEVSQPNYEKLADQILDYREDVLNAVKQKPELAQNAKALIEKFASTDRNIKRRKASEEFLRELEQAQSQFETTDPASVAPPQPTRPVHDQ